MTPSLSLKRSSPNDEAIPSLDSTQNTMSSPSKRQCRSPQTAPTPRLRFPIPSRDVPSGTPHSSLVTTADKLTLRLVIPQEPLSHKLQKRIDRHKRDAERWKTKLQRPYPKQHEIKKAYPLKLMRHYPSKPGQQVQPAIKIPKIIKNHRIPQPLRESPTQEAVKREDATSKDADRIPDPGAPFHQPTTFTERRRDLKRARRETEEVQWNKIRTRCEYAQRLAHQCFSISEQRCGEGRRDGGREDMVLSGIDYSDMVLEGAGQHNGMPAWARYQTGQFAAGQQRFNGLP